MKKFPLLLLLFILFTLATAIVVEAQASSKFVERGKKIYTVMTTKWVLFVGGLILLFVFWYNAMRAGLSKSGLDERYQKPIAISLSIGFTLVILVALATSGITTPEQVIDNFIFKCDQGSRGAPGIGPQCEDGEFTWIGWFIGFAAALIIGGLSYKFAKGFFGES